MITNDDIYCVMDGRAAHDPDDATVLVADPDPHEACKDANSGDYGSDVLVVKNASEVMWGWLSGGKWKVTQ